MQQLTPLPQILNQKVLRPTTIIVQVLCPLIKRNSVLDKKLRKYWMRVTDGRVIMNFALSRKVNKAAINLKTGDIVRFDETSWTKVEIDDEIGFKIVTTEFEVLEHSKVRSDSTTKFWGIGPEPKNTPVKQAIKDDKDDIDDNDIDDDGDNNDIDDDDDNNENDDNDINNDDNGDHENSQRKSAENSVISDISSESSKEEDKARQSLKTKRPNETSDEERKAKRQRVANVGPSLSKYKKEDIASARYCFYNFAGLVLAKQWQSFEAVTILKSSTTVAINHCYQSSFGTLSVVVILRAGNGTVTAYCVDETGTDLSSCNINQLLVYVGPSSPLQIEQGVKLWKKLQDEDCLSPTTTKPSATSPYKPPSHNTSPAPPNNSPELQAIRKKANNLAERLQIAEEQLQTIDEQQQRILSLEQSVNSLQRQMKEMNDSWVATFENLRREDKKKLKKQEKKIKRAAQYVVQQPPPQMPLQMPMHPHYMMPPHYPPMPPQHSYPRY